MSPRSRGLGIPGHPNRDESGPPLGKPARARSGSGRARSIRSDRVESSSALISDGSRIDPDRLLRLDAVRDLDSFRQPRDQAGRLSEKAALWNERRHRCRHGSRGEQRARRDGRCREIATQRGVERLCERGTSPIKSGAAGPVAEVVKGLGIADGVTKPPATFMKRSASVSISDRFESVKVRRTVPGARYSYMTELGSWLSPRPECVSSSWIAERHEVELVRADLARVSRSRVIPAGHEIDIVLRCRVPEHAVCDAPLRRGVGEMDGDIRGRACGGPAQVHTERCQSLNRDRSWRRQARRSRSGPGQGQCRPQPSRSGPVR